MADQNLEFEPSEEDLNHLREWIAKSPHIVQDYDDKMLTAFVRGCKGSLQKTKKVLEDFNKLGQSCPQIIRNYDPNDQRLVEYLSESLIFPLPKKTPDGSVAFMGLAKPYDSFKQDPYKVYGPEFFRYWLLSLYIYIWKNDFGPGKWTIIADCEYSSVIHSREFTPAAMKQIIEIMQNALPARLQGVHIINLPPFMAWIFNLAKSMAKKKISDRIYFHSMMETFYEKFPKEILPKEYGGNEESMFTIHDQWFETVKSFRKKFLDEESKMRKLDPLRPKSEDANGMEGTFRALSLD